MKKFEKVLLSTNEAQIQNELSPRKLSKAYFQPFVEKYNLLGLKPLEEKDLNPLFDNPKAFLTQQITHGESLNIGGLKMNPEKLFEIIEKPAGTDELIRQIVTDKANHVIASQNHWHTDHLVIKNGDTVEICPILLNHITERCSLYIENEAQQEAFDLIDVIAENINRLNELKPLNNISEDVFFTQIIAKKGGKYQKRFEAVKHFK
jgi:hypothetical protein